MTTKRAARPEGTMLVLFFGQSPHFDEGIITAFNQITDSQSIVFLVPKSNTDNDLRYQALQNVSFWTRSNRTSKLNTLLLKVTSIVELFRQIKRADYLLLNGLFFPSILLVLIVFIANGRPLAAFAWGGDFYDYYYTSSRLRRYAISHFTLIGLGIIKERHIFSRSYPGFNGTFSEFATPLPKKQYQFLLDSLKNSDKHIAKTATTCTSLEHNIMVGHSAHESNNHFDIIKRISRSSNKSSIVTLMLTYGDNQYGQSVYQYACSLLGKNRVVVYWNWLDPCVYLEKLACVSVGIFDQNRQQAGKNILFLAALGKPVFVNPLNTMYEYLLDHEIDCKSTSFVDHYLDGKLEFTVSNSSICKAMNLLSESFSIDILRKFHAKLVSQ